MNSFFSTLAALVYLAGLVGSYPSGAPSCTVAPGHGEANGNGALAVKDLGNDVWEVSTSEGFKGIVINALTPGKWSKVPKGFEALETCVTHTDNTFKTGVTKFQFISEGGRPKFNGYVVYSYDSYASLSA